MSWRDNVTQHSGGIISYRYGARASRSKYQRRIILSRAHGVSTSRAYLRAGIVAICIWRKMWRRVAKVAAAIKQA